MEVTKWLKPSDTRTSVTLPKQRSGLYLYRDRFAGTVTIQRVLFIG